MRGPLWEGFWPYLDPRDCVRLRTASTHWSVPERYGTQGELLFFLIEKEPFVLTMEVEFRPCVAAETLKACALVGLHMMAEESALWPDSDSSLHLGRHVGVWLPKKHHVGQQRR